MYDTLIDTDVPECRVRRAAVLAVCGRLSRAALQALVDEYVAAARAAAIPRVSQAVAALCPQGWATLSVATVVALARVHTEHSVGERACAAARERIEATAREAADEKHRKEAGILERQRVIQTRGLGPGPLPPAPPPAPATPQRRVGTEADAWASPVARGVQSMDMDSPQTRR
jgi:hypothetical protein